MISDELRPLRDVLRTRLRLVERRVAAQNSIARLLEKHNARDVVELDAFGRIQAECHIEQAESLYAHTAGRAESDATRTALAHAQALFLPVAPPHSCRVAL